ncbi:MAG: hypothetical protein CMF94_01975, partial [Candidatus Marinimicrobia bacterium]|nr:hypothetical protein [Candidatus Neomarinimicrobiota bacterium]
MKIKALRLVEVNEFVRRQVKGSGKTYSESLSFREIAEHAQEQMEKNIFKAGYRKGVRVVKVNKSLVDKFVCPFVKITSETKLVSRLIKRQCNEEPYIQTRALNGMLLQAGKVELILYSNKVLKENNENSTNAEWELISINSVPEGVSHLPIGPVTMMRNQLNLNGGTKGRYSSDDWAKSIRFYQKYIV